jgi:hypothetical protein
MLAKLLGGSAYASKKMLLEFELSCARSFGFYDFEDLRLVSVVCCHYCFFGTGVDSYLDRLRNNLL